MRQPRGLSGQPVLLVEDESRLREMLVQGTREMGFAPAGAASAEQALKILERHPYPVIVVDLNLPGADGLELLRTVRERWPNTQAIILTGFGDLQAAREAIHLEVVDFLTKPCALGDLEIALGRAFRRLQQIQPTALDPKYDDIDPEDEDDHDPHTKAVGSPNKPKAPMAFTPREASEALSMEEVERKAIFAMLEKHNGNRAATAAELGISIRKLYYRLGEYQKKGLSS
jgi:DNA-binding NtrC family response regulator